MSDPVFLASDEVLILHTLSIQRFGGDDGLRDRNGAEAAVEQPKNTFHYGGGDLFDISAAYAFHVAQAQAFLDGNKRTGIAAALAFLERNNVRVVFVWQDLYEAMIAIAERRTDKVGFAELLRSQARKQLAAASALLVSQQVGRRAGGS